MRGENRSLSQMITEHFVQHGASTSRRPAAGGLNIDTGAQNREGGRASASSKLPTGGRGFFSSMRHKQPGDADQEAEERMGLVGHSAQFAGSEEGHARVGAGHRASDSRSSSRMSGSSDTESLDDERKPNAGSRFRDDNDKDTYPRRRL